MPARNHDIHHWQMLNPVTTEALIMLTLGAPQLLYNGGMLLAPVRYFAVEGGVVRPGMPQDVGALVSKVSKMELEVTLVNMSAVFPRSMVVQAGTLREHRFTSVAFTALTSAYPAAVGAYASPDVETTTESVTVDGSDFTVLLPPGTQVKLTIGLIRNVNFPTYDFPTVAA
jgi:hypothetical protein